MHYISELAIYSVINFSWWQWKCIALHAKFILVFTECTKCVRVHCTRYWMSKILKNLREHSIWSCSIINSVKLYSWCALWQSSLLTWIFCGRKARKSRSVVSKFLVGVPEVFFTDTYTQHFFLLTIFHRICSASAVSLLYPEELFFPALLHLVSFGPKPLKFLLGYSAGEADPQLGNGVPWVTRFF